MKKITREKALIAHMNNIIGGATTVEGKDGNSSINDNALTVLEYLKQQQPPTFLDIEKAWGDCFNRNSENSEHRAGSFTVLLKHSKELGGHYVEVKIWEILTYLITLDYFELPSTTTSAKMMRVIYKTVEYLESLAEK